MIKFNTERYGEVHLNFEYNYPYDTTATLYQKTGDKEYTVLESAFVSRFHTDPWDRKVGRKYAFAKLMKLSPMDRADRTLAWEAFKSACTMPK